MFDIRRAVCFVGAQSSFFFTPSVFYFYPTKSFSKPCTCRDLCCPELFLSSVCQLGCDCHGCASPYILETGVCIAYDRDMAKRRQCWKTPSLSWMTLAARLRCVSCKSSACSLSISFLSCSSLFMYEADWCGDFWVMGSC